MKFGRANTGRANTATPTTGSHIAIQHIGRPNVAILGFSLLSNGLRRIGRRISRLSFCRREIGVRA